MIFDRYGPRLICFQKTLLPIKGIYGIMKILHFVPVWVINCEIEENRFMVFNSAHYIISYHLFI